MRGIASFPHPLMALMFLALQLHTALGRHCEQICVRKGSPTNNASLTSITLSSAPLPDQANVFIGTCNAYSLMRRAAMPLILCYTASRYMWPRSLASRVPS